MLSGLWKEWVGEGQGDTIFAALGDLAIVGDGAKPAPFCDAGGRFLIVVTAKGDIASAIAWVLMGSSSSGSGLTNLLSAARIGRPWALRWIFALEALENSGLLFEDGETLLLTGEIISSLKER